MKKFLNGIALLLCVMSFCVFAGCSYANNSPAPAPDPIPGQAAAPVLNPESGDIDYGDTVEITCATEGASIHYTTDGTAPTSSNTKYTAAIEIKADTTIKAIAVKFGMTSSEVASSTYTIKKYTVTFDANGHGTAPDPVTDKHKGEIITLSKLNESGYTFDGWTDGENSFGAGTEYTIESDVILKAKWIGWNDVNTPSFSVTDNVVDYGDTVEITCATFGADIYYTTDGTAPTSSSTKYTSPIEIKADTIIKAIALKSGMNDSVVSEKAYTIKKYTVTFDADGHGTAPDPMTGKHKDETITLPAALTATGYLFEKWNDGTTDYAAEADYTVTGDVTIKAVWKDVTPPATVTNLSATCIASGTVKLTWTNPQDTDFAKVVITYDTDKSVTVLKTATPNNEATITGLTNGTEYTFTVKTYDDSENASSGLKIDYIITPAELTQAGTRPSNVTGTQTLPTFKTNITDHLYLAESSANATGWIACYETSNVSTYQWYTGTTDNWKKVTSKGTDNCLEITVTAGTTYYMLEAKSSDGQSIAYSNVCTVVCGGEKTTNIGKIAYKNGTETFAYSDYNVSYGLPIGIIFDVNEDGTPKTIVNFKEDHSKKWCSPFAQGYNKSFNTSLTDGSSNWQIICDNVDDEDTEGNYPAFEYCNGFTDGGKTWYLPARDELMTLYFNRTAVNTAIETLIGKGISVVSLEMWGWIWSSSDFASGDFCAWYVNINNGNQVYGIEGEGKAYDVFVRAVAHF